MTRSEKFSAFLGRIEMAVVALAMCFGLVVFPYANVTLGGWGMAGAALLLLAGIVLAAIALCFSGRLSLDMFTRWRPAYVVIGGVALRVVAGVIAQPEAVSDGKEYLLLARHLASGQPYVDTRGGLAFWPPGYPLVLAPFVYLFGATSSAVLIANLCLYVICAASIYVLASVTFDRRVARIALALVTIWPSYLLLAPIPAKENSTIAMCVAAIACFTSVFVANRAGRPPWLAAAGGGASLGLAGLAQPGVMLLAPLVPIAYREWLRPVTWREVMLAAVAAAAFVSTTGTWIARNYVVFDRQYIGVATNGGSVMYRANNEIATGLWIEEGKRPLHGYPELEADRLGKAWALEWMRAHPFDMLKLSAMKVLYFVSNDNHGAYWTVTRGRGADEKSAHAQLRDSPLRWAILSSTYFLSNAFWLLVLASTAWRLRTLMTSRTREWAKAIPLVYPFLYLLAVHSVFESGSRHHMAAVALLLVVAAFHLARPAARASASVSR